MVERDEMALYLDGLLEVSRFRDYCPNGLQVEGRPQIRRLVTGVTASQALLDAAVKAKADAVLVHHGYFWKGEDARVVGMKARRLHTLLTHGVSLFAYHLPLDAHPEYGNNRQLGDRLGIRIRGELDTGIQPSVGVWGELDRPMSGAEFAAHITRQLGREPVHVAGGAEPIRTLAWCTGAGQRFIDNAALLGVDAYVSGEISEPTAHTAREAAVHYFAAGHHATERYGVQALGDHLAERFGVEHQYIEVTNPA